MNASGRTLAAAILLIVGLGMKAEEPQQITCKTEGKNFHCFAPNGELDKFLPYWTLHTKQPMSAYGTEFTGPAPERWTTLTADFHNEFGDVTSQACVWVKRINGRAKFEEECGQKPALYPD